MWVLYGLLGLLALLLVIFSIPIRCRISYDGELITSFRLLGVQLQRVPFLEAMVTSTSRSARKSGRRSTTEIAVERLREMATLIKQDDLAGTLHFLCETAKLVGQTIGRLLRSIRVKRLDLQMLIAAEDPDITAQRYGQVCSVLYPALAGIEQAVRIRHRNVRVEPNFLLEQTSVRFDLRFRITIGRLLIALFALAWGFLMIEEQNDPQITKEVS